MQRVGEKEETEEWIDTFDMRDEDGREEGVLNEIAERNERMKQLQLKSGARLRTSTI